MNRRILSMLPDSELLVLIKIIEKGHEKYKQLIRIQVTLSELLNTGLPGILIEKGVFECMGHPFKHFDILGVETDNYAFSENILGVGTDNYAFSENVVDGKTLNVVDGKTLNVPEREILIKGAWIDASNKIDPKAVEKVRDRIAASSVHYSKIYGALDKYVDNEVDVLGLYKVLSGETLAPSVVRDTFNYILNPNNPIVIISADRLGAEKFANKCFNQKLKHPRITWVRDIERVKGTEYKFAFTVNPGHNFNSRFAVNEIEVLLERRGCKILNAY